MELTYEMLTKLDMEGGPAKARFMEWLLVDPVHGCIQYATNAERPAIQAVADLWARMADREIVRREELDAALDAAWSASNNAASESACAAAAAAASESVLDAADWASGESAWDAFQSAWDAAKA